MRFRSYTGGNEREALYLAKRELGDDILILDVCREPVSGRQNGDTKKVTIKVAIDPRLSKPEVTRDHGDQPRALAAVNNNPQRIQPIVTKDSEQVAELFLLRQQLRSIKAQVRAARSCPFSEPFNECFNLLTESGVPENVAETLVLRTEEQQVGMSGNGPIPLEQGLSELRRQISYLFPSPHQERARKKREIIVVAGPSGAGKTSLLVKMASHKEVYLNRKVGIITTDIFRAGATAGLKSLGKILSIPIFEIKQLDDIPRALKNMEKCDVILVDTPGRSPLSKGSMPDLQTQLAVLRPDETLLVLSANMALEEQWLFIGLYQGIHPSALVITKLDETSKPGKVLAFADNPELPLKYVTTGQAVPDSLQIQVGRAVIKRLPLAMGRLVN
ncbi:hypothetical protein ACFL5M_03485 [Candidatus Neomarinimicrobiota bacterium]